MENFIRVIKKGGPGSGSWEGPGDPRFPMNPQSAITEIEGARFAKIKLESGRVILLRNPKRITVQGQPGWTGIEINREGDEIVPRGATERLHMIQESAIVSATRMRMNNKYGELEEDK